MEQLNLYLFRRNDRVRRIKPNRRTVVSYFQQRRWQLITLLEQLSGFWPQQRKLQQYPLQLYHAFVILTLFFAEANKLRECIGVDPDMTIECCLLLFVCVGMLVKLMFASIQQYNRRKVYKRIAKHFETMRDSEEATVLSEGAERGFKHTLYYMCTICALLVTFVSVPVLRAFYKYFFNHHELKVQMPVPLNYGFDHNKYWYIIALDFLVYFFSTLLVEFTFDLSFVLQVQHAAALFKIVGIRLRKASELTDEMENRTMSDDDAEESYSLISSAIDLHSECFKVVKLIEKSYSMNWFIILMLSTGGFGAGIHVISTKLHDPIDTFRYCVAFVMIVLHFQMIFSRGQIITNSAESVSDACCECKWYGLPKKSRKLLLIMMIRTSIPCQLTGAKLFPLSMETFSKMLKAGLPYYTVFKSK